MTVHVQIHRVPSVSERTRRLLRAEPASGAVQVSDITWLPLTEQVQGIVTDRVSTHTASIRFRRDSITATRCSCRADAACEHIAALLEHAAGTVVPAEDPESTRAWASTCALITREAPTAPPPSPPGFAVQFAVTADERLVATPAVLSPRKVIAITWRALTTRAAGDPGAIVMQALSALVDAGERWLDLTAADQRVWPLLAAVTATRTPLLHSANGQHSQVTLEDAASVTLRAVDAGSAAHLQPALTIGGIEQPKPVRLLPLGNSHAHGLAWWDERLRLHLAPLSAPASATLLRLAEQHLPIPVPRTDLADFNTDVHPHLAAAVTIVDPDQVLTAPTVTAGPTAILSITCLRDADSDNPPASYQLQWLVRYTVDGAPADSPALGSSAGERWRDKRAEQQLWERLDAHLETIAGDDTGQPGLAAGMNPDQLRRSRLRTTTVDAPIAATLIDQTLPSLPDTDDLLIEVAADVPNFQHTMTVPTVQFEPGPKGLGRDWLNLTITVGVDGHRLGIEEVIRQLTAGATHLVFPGGVYTTANIPELERLATLLDEARRVRELTDDDLVPADTANATLWQEILDCGQADEAIADWSARQHTLASGGDGVTDVALPDTVHAELRPYQQDGFNWLCFLLDQRTGGILADDMGLGKTLQLLAAMARTLQNEPGARFLVIAPTSVVANWLAEAARFVPTITATAIRSTMKAGGPSQTSRADTATLVVTTYALARLDIDYYAATDWTLVVCDEAQHLKNPKSKAHAAIKSIRARSFIAATGTPIENTLLDLWSLLDLSTPGLFPSRPAFTDYYLNPVEKSGDRDRLEQLRHRIRPYLLRRTKTEVASDLPDRQDQTIMLDLDDEHRRIYDLRLNRERQKALDLLALDDPTARFEVLSALTRLRQLSLHAGLVDDDHLTVASAKIDYLAEQLPELVAAGHSALVFSVFPSFLRLLQPALEGAGLAVAYLDGTLSATERTEQITAFTTGSADVFLISLKAGGSGINLVRADHVFICDPWWNPAAESQATDRAHRIGQTRPVNVCRLVAADTIEGKVVDLQNTKRGLATATLDDGAFATTLSVDEIRRLLSS